MSLSPLAIRLFCDIATPANLQDLNRLSQVPTFYRGDDIEFDIGIGELGDLITPLAGVASVTLQIFELENDTNAALISATVLAGALNTALTQEEWDNDTAPYQHAAFVIPSAQTAISLGGASSVSYWLRITAQTTDATPKTITLADGSITIRDGPATAPAINLTGPNFGVMQFGSTTAFVLMDPSTGLYHTWTLLNTAGVLSFQIGDAAYPGPVQAFLFPAGCNFRSFTVGGQVVLQALDASTGLFHTISLLNTAGVLSIQISDTGY